ncbi:MAG: Ku protein, partial [Thermodesulfobacteriota bacterium]
GQLGAFWSGSLTFGLVNIPVDLYSTHRPRPAALRMLASDGAAMHRRYNCPRDRRPLAAEAIIRGHEIETGRFIPVSDQELAAVEPKKSREIDLRTFVAVAELDPVLFQHAYCLLPAGTVSRAYRLLAATMERSGRAAIGTFVMREREHLVAILAEGGLLRAEILRFADEIRSPAELGLPPLPEACPKLAGRLRQEMDRLFRPELAPDLMADRYAQRLADLVREKLAAGKDVLDQPPLPAAAAAVGAEVIDLMAIIKSRFPAAPAGKGGGRRPASGKRP